jgi:hypothetical protein
MNTADYFIAYACMGLAYSLPKAYGFLEFLSREPGWHEEIPGPAWVVSFVAATIIMGGTLTLAATWPFWLVKSFFRRR